MPTGARTYGVGAGPCIIRFGLRRPRPPSQLTEREYLGRHGEGGMKKGPGGVGREALGSQRG